VVARLDFEEAEQVRRKGSLHEKSSVPGHAANPLRRQSVATPLASGPDWFLLPGLLCSAGDPEAEEGIYPIRVNGRRLLSRPAPSHG
jgi:hypothetical protein